MAAPVLLHSDRYRDSVWQLLSPILAVAIAVLGVVQGDPISLLMGLGLLAYVWFTRHTRYEIFEDRLVISYGNPRKRVFPLAEISDVRLIKSPIGGGGTVIVSKKRGGPMVLRPREAEGFAAALAKALGKAPEIGPGAAPEPETPVRRPPRSRPRRIGNRGQDGQRHDE